jgi:hypothetical protein
MLPCSADTPHLGPRQPILIGKFALGLTAAVLPTDTIVTARVFAELGEVVEDNVRHLL